MIAPLMFNDNETMVSDEVELGVEEPVISINHNEDLIKDGFE